MTCPSKTRRESYTFVCPQCGQTHAITWWQGEEMKFRERDLFVPKLAEYIYEPPMIEYVKTRWPLPCAVPVVREVLWVDDTKHIRSMVLRYLSCDTRGY